MNENSYLWRVQVLGKEKVEIAQFEDGKAVGKKDIYSYLRLNNEGIIYKGNIINL